MSWFQVPFHMVFHGKSFITYFTLMRLFPLMNCQNMSSHWSFLSKWFLANLTLKRLFPLMNWINMFVQASFVGKLYIGKVWFPDEQFENVGSNGLYKHILNHNYCTEKVFHQHDQKKYELLTQPYWCTVYYKCHIQNVFFHHELMLCVSLKTIFDLWIFWM